MLLEPDLAEILAVTSLSDPDNHLSNDAKFNDLINKVLEYVQYLEDYIHICNRPHDDFTFLDNPTHGVILLSTTELFHIKPFHTEPLHHYPQFLPPNDPICITYPLHARLKFIVPDSLFRFVHQSVPTRTGRRA